jgi:hypothetical protein
MYIHNEIFANLTLPTKVAWKHKHIKTTTAQPSFLRWRCNAVCNKVSVELAANNVSGYNTSNDGNRKYIVARLNYLAERCSHAEANVSTPSNPLTNTDRQREERKQKKERKQGKNDRGMISNNAKSK